MADNDEKKDGIVPIPDVLDQAKTPVKQEKINEMGNPKQLIDYTEKTPPQNHEKQPEKVSLRQWFNNLGWQESPFTFAITPYLFVGYSNQITYMHVLSTFLIKYFPAIPHAATIIVSFSILFIVTNIVL